MQGDGWIFWTLFAFLCGSVPFSLLVGFWVLKVDVRRYGDGNPGASNVIRAGGWRVGIPAILLDSFKGAAPVRPAYFLVGILDGVDAGHGPDLAWFLSTLGVFHGRGERLGCCPGDAGVAGRASLEPTRLGFLGGLAGKHGDTDLQTSP